MTTISASLVKELRDKTGAGMMDCKTALTEVKGDIESAVDWLRKKGLSKAANKAGRIAAEGLIGVIAKDKAGAMVEVNSETDFVARNEQFQDMVRKITALAPKAEGDLKKLLALTYPGKSVTVEDHVKEMVATIGENMSVRRTVAMSVGEGHVAEYVHNKAADGLGKIGVLVVLESKGDKAALAGFGRQLAMHIAAAAPAAITAEELDPALIERERAVYTGAGQSFRQVARDRRQDGGRAPAQGVLPAGGAACSRPSSAPAATARQPSRRCSRAAEKTAGAPIKIAKFARYALGEGIDKKDGDFAAEVAKVAGKR